MRALVPPGVVLACTFFALQVLLFEVLRMCLYVRNHDLADAAGAITIARAFWVGLRFDMAVAAYSSMPLVILANAAALRWGYSGERRVYVLGTAAIGALFVLLGLGELEFYREFTARYNSLAIEYWSQPKTVGSMIWYGYPVMRYLLVATAMCTVFIWTLVRIGRAWAKRVDPARWCGLWQRTAVMTGMLLLLVLTVRGGTRGTPLQWSDAIHSDSTFANQLAQNGFWTLGRAALVYSDASRGSEVWKACMSPEEAHERTQRMLLLPHEELIGDTSKYPLLRRSLGGQRSVYLRTFSTEPPNVVVVIMETFSARCVGAIGSDNGRTPEYDRLAEHGILFDRCFSNGSHTHQAIYGVGACFPNLPGHECMMQSLHAEQKFDSLPATLKERGYSTMFLYNGDFAWDDMQGFYRMQGVDRFIGRDDFDRSTFRDATWGVSDQELFERANQEFTKAKRPFCAMVLTLSNHSPFNLPRPLPFPEVTDAGNLNNQMNGIRFADWAVGHFFELARRESYFRNTIFVLVGDHGFCARPILTDIGLLRFHVPLLFYAPDLLGDEKRVRHTVAGHTSIAPTILGLLGDAAPHQHWGRDLFALPDDDPGFAFFKLGSSGRDVGYARGDILLVGGKSGKGPLYHYDLGFPPSVTPFEPQDPEQHREMERDLAAYIQTGLEVLTQHHAVP